jgi:hypothetical protein
MWPAGRTLDEDPGPVKFFKQFVERKGLNETYVINPRYDGKKRQFS